VWVQRGDESAHSQARTRSLSLALYQSCYLVRALSLSFLAPLSKLSHSPAHISPRPPLSLSLPLSLFLSISLTLSLPGSIAYSLSLSLARALPILAQSPVYMSPRLQGRVGGGGG